jgi:hypothetical protein
MQAYAAYAASLFNYYELAVSQLNGRRHARSQSQSYFMTGGLQPISLSWRQDP